MIKGIWAWLTRRRKVTLRDCKVAQDATGAGFITTAKALTDANVEALRRELEATWQGLPRES